MSISKPKEVELTLILFKGLKALQTVNCRFLNFQGTSFQAWVMRVIWTWMDQKSFGGYPLCTTIAWILGLQLTWILCLGLMDTKLMRLGFWIFEKFHSGQSYACLNMDRGNLAKRLIFGRNCLMVTIFARPKLRPERSEYPEVKLTWILFLWQLHFQGLVMGTVIVPKVHF